MASMMQHKQNKFWSWLMLLVISSTATADSTRHDWESRLQGNAIVLLGEVHDNAEHHRQRLAILQRAFKAGWRPAIAMEQFDRERQVDIDQARRERPHDADYLIDKAARSGQKNSGWNWRYYRPYVALALQYDVPLLAANLSRGEAGSIVERGYAAVFDEHAITSVGLDRVPEVLVSAQQQEVEAGHCHLLPKDLLPAMARAQLARDAVMAATLRAHAAEGIVLLAGDNHVRRDIGVPVWLDQPDFDQTWHERLFAVGFLEQDDPPPPDAAFDAVVITKRAERTDPCATLRRTHRNP